MRGFHMSSSSSQTLATDLPDSNQDQSSVSHSPVKERLLRVHEAFHRGDIQSAKQLMDTIDPESLTEEEEKQLQQYQSRLKFDPVELYLPIILFVFWALIFWNTIH